MRVAVVVNPRARRGTGTRLGREVEAALQAIGIETVLVAEPSPAVTLERARNLTAIDGSGRNISLPTS